MAKTIEEKAKTFADGCKFKSNFPHDHASVMAGFMEGYRLGLKAGLDAYDENYEDEDYEHPNNMQHD